MTGNGASTRRGPIPLLELLHPDGSAERTVEMGGGRARGENSGPAVDLVLLTPSRSERRSRAWAGEAAELAASVSGDGLVVLSASSRPVRARMAASGLERTLELLHVPDLARSRYLLPLRGAASRYAVARLLPLSPLKRVAVRLLAIPGAARLGPTTVVFRRRGARPLLEWLDAIDPSPHSASAVLSRSESPGSSVVVHRFGGRSGPVSVAKLGPNAGEEAEALRDCATSAEGTSADAPILLAQGALGDRAVIVETPIDGRPASRALAGSPRRAGRLMRSVAAWLAEWNGATAMRRDFEAVDAQRWLLDPVRRLGPTLAAGGIHIDRLERLCAECRGESLEFVMAHNDLTAANVLIDGSRLGIVDWEKAAREWLPLSDLAYATADFAAAAGSYGDRPAAFEDCFRPAGRFAELCRGLLREAAEARQLSEPMAELCFHACWLHHAENERRADPSAAPGKTPFMTILGRVAAEPPAVAT